MVVHRSSVLATRYVQAALAALLFVALLIPRAAMPASTHAASGLDCEYFTYQEDAQVSLDDTQKNYPDLFSQWSANLDPDGNGVACDQLPQRPDLLVGTQSVLGKFDDSDDDGFIVTGVGYASRYNVTLAGVTFTSDCPQIDEDLLTSLVQPPDKQATSFFVASSTRKPLPPDDEDNVWSVVGLAWFIAGDPSNPVLANEWLLQSGLAKFDPSTTPGEYADRLQAAEDAARSAGIGVWGSCDFSNTAIGADTTTAYAHLLRKSGEGDQIVPFTIETEGTYQLTVDAMGGAVVFVAADIYATDGTWFPEFGIISSDSGAFTSASYLYPGNYYVQVKSVGGWRLTIDAL